MTVRRGEDWGWPATVPGDAVEVRSDAALAVAVAERTPVVVRGGDVHRSLGAPTGAPARSYRIDVMRVVADDFVGIAVAHAVVRRRGVAGWWRGPITAVMNVDHLGEWDVAPRAHPNDGWLDVLAVTPSMLLRARWQAWRRLSTGTHIPHPDISVRRTRADAATFERPVWLWVDGVRRGRSRSLSVAIEPDGAVIYA